MMIKVGDEYLDFTGDIVIEKQLFKFDTLETTGTFSYSATLDETTHNRRIIEALDLNNNTSISIIDDVRIFTDSGVLLYIGYIILDDPYTLAFSFYSDNNNFISRITGNCIDLDLSQYDCVLNESNIVNSWQATEGIVFPLCDRGGLSDGDELLRKDAFMKLQIFFGRVTQNDWQPFVFLKHAIDAIMLKSGLKITGDLIKDPTYQSLITTNNNLELKKSIIDNQNISVATETIQTIPNSLASRVKVNFELSSELPQFNSPLGNWDPVLMRWTASYDCRFKFHFNFVVSDASKEIHWGVRRNSEVGTGVQYFTRSTSVSFFHNSYATSLITHADAGDYYELWAYVDSGTPGTVDIIEGTWTTEMVDTNMCFASALLPNIDNKSLLADIFKMFNVVADYDVYSKTINTVFSRNIKDRDEQDLSNYIHSIKSITNSDLISNFSQKNKLLYGQADMDEIEEYNSKEETTWGGGDLIINNRSLDLSQEIFTLNFTAPFVYKNEAFGLYLIKLNFAQYSAEDDDFTVAITSVTDGSPLGIFNTASGAFSYYNNNFVDAATGSLHEVGYADSNSNTQIIAIYAHNVDLPKPFRFTQSTGISDDDNEIHRIFDMTTPVYNGHWEQTTWASVTRPIAGVAIFVKSLDGSSLDIIKQGLSFGDIDGFNSLTLIDSYYSDIQKSFNDPVNPIIDFIIPENVFLSLDLTKPVRIKSDKVNGKFIINKCTGYTNSYTPCTLELIKLSV